MSLKKTETQTYKAITNQQYLNAKQLSMLSLAIIILIQMIPIFVTRTPYLEWMLLGFTAAVSTCAVMGAILVQYNADKISKLYRNINVTYRANPTCTPSTNTLSLLISH